jgi:hypothetical protein
VIGSPANTLRANGTVSFNDASTNSYDTIDFVAEKRRLGVTPHVTQNTKGRRSAIDCCTTRHPGYPVSLRGRKRIEEERSAKRT